MDELHAALVDALRDAIEDFSVQLADHDAGPARASREQQLRVLRDRLAETEKKEAAIWEKYTEGMPRPVFESLLEKVQKQKEDISAMIAQSVAAQDEPDLSERIATFSEALDALMDPNVPAEIKNGLLKACVRQITYRRERGERKKGRVVGRGWSMPPVELDIELLL